VGKIQEAIEQYEQALRIWPDYAEAHCNLGIALEQTGKVREGIGQYEQALRIKTDYPKVQNHLAWLLATRLDVADPVRAVTLAEQACKLTDYHVASYLDTLAAAYAAAGRFGDAITTNERAAELSQAAGPPELTERIKARLALYRSGHAYWQPVGETKLHSP
jgi:spermidine synthase